MIFVTNVSGPSVSLSSDNQPAPIVDEVSATVTYLGYAGMGTLQTAPYWRISRTTISGTVTITEYADGDLLFDNIWANRAALTYAR